MGSKGQATPTVERRRLAQERGRKLCDRLNAEDDDG